MCSGVWKRSERAGGSAKTTTTSVLDPHLSVLDLLEKGGPSSEGQQQSRDFKGLSLELRSVLLNEDTSISWSWQNIMHPPASPLGNQVGVLSSTDTSEEEDLAEPITNPLLEHSSATASSSSSSFVMPKLRLSQNKSLSHFHILLLGDMNFIFYRNCIPSCYSNLFTLPDDNGMQDIINSTAILIATAHPESLIPILNKVTACSPGKFVIPICYNCNMTRRQLKLLIQHPFLSDKLIVLLYQPIILKSNKENYPILSKLFKFLSALAMTTTQSLEQAKHSTELTVTRKLRRTRSGRRGTLNRKKPRIFIRKDDTPENNPKYKKWVFWGLTLSVGVGVSYYFSYVACIFTTTNDYMNLISQDSTTVPSLQPWDPQHHDSDGPLVYTSLWIKHVLSNVSWALKQLIHNTSKEWALDDPDRIIALGYVLL